MSPDGYEAIIGLEVHVQLATRSKMFCGCDAAVFGAEPNTHTCPICSGQPGVLPVINRRAVEYAIMAGLALNCRIAEFTKWDRKNYHYPDLPKGYQISQYDLPLSYDGWLAVEVDGQERRIGIRRAHLEEDTGKLFHRGDSSLVDLNRAGVPLLEIVTEPDLRSADETYAFLVQLRTLLRYLGISSADMEKGAMRCEPNVSLRPAGTRQFGIQTEIKNLNSFRAVRAAIAYEIERQTKALEAGHGVARVTMGWDENRGVTVPQRTKELAEDYRYFPEPDLPPLIVDRDWVARLRAQLPELPGAKKERFQLAYHLSPYDADVLTADRAVAGFFEGIIQIYRGESKTVSNWVTGELFRLLNEAALSIEETQLNPAAVSELLTMVDHEIINSNTAKAVLEEMFRTGDAPREIVKRRNLAQISDQTTLEAAISRVLSDNPEQVEDYLAGKETVANWLMGQVMRATHGKANPKVVLALLTEKLEALREAH
jgi:aspartyl-tRNA(Asn)/glutamyl-tRNA(Gln) amidotransferase subunit B